MKRDKNTDLTAQMKTQEYDVCKMHGHVGIMDAASLLATMPICPIPPALRAWAACSPPHLALTSCSQGPWLPGVGVTKPSRPTEWGPLRVTSARTLTWSLTGL